MGQNPAVPHHTRYMSRLRLRTPGDRGASDLSIEQAMLVAVAAGFWSLVIITILK